MDLINDLDADWAKYIKGDYECNASKSYARTTTNNLNVSVNNKNNDILVSGSHLVYDPTSTNFIQVEHLPQAEKTDIECKTFTCLITSNHIIPIGKWIFHDWEDNNGSISKTGVSPVSPQTTFF